MIHFFKTCPIIWRNAHFSWRFSRQFFNHSQESVKGSQSIFVSVKNQELSKLTITLELNVTMICEVCYHARHTVVNLCVVFFRQRPSNCFKNFQISDLSASGKNTFDIWLDSKLVQIRSAFRKTELPDICQ